MNNGKKYGRFFFSVLAFLVIIGNLSVVHGEEVKDDSCHVSKQNLELKVMRPHFDFYYELLADKYAPKHVKVWNEVINEREALLKQYREIKKSGKEIANFYSEAWLQEHNELQKQFLEAVQKRDEAALKTVVPRLIDQQKELNKQLKKAIKDSK